LNAHLVWGTAAVPCFGPIAADSDNRPTSGPQRHSIRVRVYLHDAKMENYRIVQALEMPEVTHHDGNIIVVVAIYMFMANKWVAALNEITAFLLYHVQPVTTPDSIAMSVVTGQRALH